MEVLFLNFKKMRKSKIIPLIIAILTFSLSFNSWSQFSSTLTGSDCRAYYKYHMVYDNNNMLTFKFIDQSIGSYTEVEWDFGDGTTSTFTRPLHVFPEEGDYTVTLTIKNNTGDCQSIITKPVYAGTQTPFDCYNIITYTYGDDSLTVNFSGQSYFNDSLVEADYYYWDFGDGHDGLGKNITHVFDPDINLEYHVCLYTYYADTAYIWPCESWSCEDVPLYATNCQSSYDYYIIDTIDFNIGFQFINTSIGYYDSWKWDFGDGTTSTTPNPIHYFPDSTFNNVCLGIWNTNLFCLDAICDTVYAPHIAPNICVASFDFGLDSTYTTPIVYNFHNTSSGIITSVLWDFGDGTTSIELNPSHTYEETGTYEVCLFIENDNSMFDCYDDTCFTIITPNYFNMGGFAFINDFPLNNPVHIGDTALSVLYRVNPEGVIPVDSTQFSDMGYYWFTQIMEGDYMVKISLSENSASYENHFPTYCPDKILWTYADIFTLSEDIFDINIDLRPVFFNDQGPGVIQGQLGADFDMLSYGNGFNDIELVLLSENMEPLIFCYSDENGYFEFPELPLGNYYLKADATGLLSYTVMAQLDEDNNTATVEVILYEENTYGFEENNIPQSESFRIYPNPVSDQLTVEFNLDASQHLHFEIFTLLGNKLIDKHKLYSHGNNNEFIDTSSLPYGMYILTVSGINGVILNEKIIRR